MCPNWNTQERGTNREEQFTTSYGDLNQDPDCDGKSCADFHQLPGRGIGDVESLTLLNGLALQGSEGVCRAESEDRRSEACRRANGDPERDSRSPTESDEPDAMEDEESR